MLTSWRDGAARDAIVEFLSASESLPLSERVAAFDNDGTLWCEKPTYVQFDFFVDALRQACDEQPTLAQRPEYAALIRRDQQAIGDLGLPRIALALAELFVGLEPEEFSRRVRDFMGRARHQSLGVPVPRTTYVPMLELLDELRARDFTVVIVSGGGTEFVRAISQELYGVDPECVVGTSIEYEFVRLPDGRPTLRRTGRLDGVANEGMAKVSHIQSQLGRRPRLAAGNSHGDREMLEWATAVDGPSLALLVDHDDAEREYDYASKAETVDSTESITEIGRHLGWTIASIARDWDTVFTDDGRPFGAPNR